ncbi:hypothetical protein Cni_G18575 [Canna indica]|uniref:Uncharacterized protein n=1 Tax=Canna indica TaxID=4628 RepID=A0AAQ3KJH2_9LILI|nr:hypothetical protein Cni_G18575 [Canna indica]
MDCFRDVLRCILFCGREDDDVFHRSNAASTGRSIDQGGYYYHGNYWQTRPPPPLLLKSSLIYPAMRQPPPSIDPSKPPFMASPSTRRPQRHWIHHSTSHCPNLQDFRCLQNTFNDVPRWVRSGIARRKERLLAVIFAP